MGEPARQFYRELKPSGMGGIRNPVKTGEERQGQGSLWRVFWAIRSSSVQDQRQEAVARRTACFNELHKLQRELKTLFKSLLIYEAISNM